MTVVNLGSPANIQFADSASLDAFGRARVSTPLSLFNSKMIYNNQPLIYDDAQTSGGSTSSTYNSNQASVTLSVTGNVAGQRVRQSLFRPIYQPGRSQLVSMTGIIGAASANATGITCRLGQFDGYNGFYFQYGGTPGTGILSIGLRTSTSGSAVDTLVAQSSWNLDKMNGAGGSANPSGITLNAADVQIFIIDYQWLGVGRIRYGFDINGILYYVHQITPANNQALVSISNPNNPVRYEITSAGTGTSATASLTQICASITSESGATSNGYPFSTSTGGGTPLTTAANTSIYPLIALQLQSTMLSTEVDLQSYSVYSSTSNAIMLVQVILNPTITGTALSYSNVTNGGTQYALGTGSTTLSGGTVIYQEYVSVGKTTQTGTLGIFADLGAYINGTSETLILAITSVSGAAITVYGALNWLETQ